MSTSTNFVTAEQLYLMPRDGVRRELVRGELHTMTPAGYRHGVVIMRLAAKLDQHVVANRLGVVSGAETGFVLTRDPDTVRGADIGFVSQSRIEEGGIPESFYPGTPDLAVEVISPSDRAGEVDAKARDWLSHGVRLLWIIDPRSRTVAVHRPSEPVKTLTEDDTLDGEDVVQGFRCPVRDIFVDDPTQSDSQ